jgi:hypothetical protein
MIKTEFDIYLVNFETGMSIFTFLLEGKCPMIMMLFEIGEQVLTTKCGIRDEQISMREAFANTVEI